MTGLTGTVATAVFEAASKVTAAANRILGQAGRAVASLSSIQPQVITKQAQVDKLAAQVDGWDKVGRLHLPRLVEVGVGCLAVVAEWQINKSASEGLFLSSRATILITMGLTVITFLLGYGLGHLARVQLRQKHAGDLSTVTPFIVALGVATAGFLFLTGALRWNYLRIHDTVAGVAGVGLPPAMQAAALTALSGLFMAMLAGAVMFTDPELARAERQLRKARRALARLERLAQKLNVVLGTLRRQAIRLIGDVVQASAKEMTASGTTPDLTELRSYITQLLGLEELVGGVSPPGPDPSSPVTVAPAPQPPEPLLGRVVGRQSVVDSAIMVSPSVDRNGSGGAQGS